MAEAVATFEIQLGMLLRKAIISTLRRECLLRSVSIQVEETRNLLESYYAVSLRGDEGAVRGIAEGMVRRINEIAMS